MRVSVENIAWRCVCMFFYLYEPQFQVKSSVVRTFLCGGDILVGPHNLKEQFELKQR